MSNTFSQIYIQIVFSVKGREPLINSLWEDELYKYITGVVTKKDHKLIIVNGMPDHVHILIGMKPTSSLSDLVREIKKSTTGFIKVRNFSKFKFQWQEGYGAFSYSYDELRAVIKYIENQKEHHKKYSFKEEFLTLLRYHKIEFKEEYVF